MLFLFGYSLSLWLAKLLKLMENGHPCHPRCKQTQMNLQLQCAETIQSQIVEIMTLLSQTKSIPKY